MSKIILFDGVCNFCNTYINFIIKNDKTGKYYFAPLQSKVGRDFLFKYPKLKSVDSIILIEDSIPFIHSSAILRIAKNLDGYWKLLFVFILLPKFFRDFLYKQFAKKRYQWFGKKEVCMIPTKEIRERFLNE